MTEWRVKAGQGDRQTVAIAPFINETDEHIDPQLDTMLSETETLARQRAASRASSASERQDEMIRQVEGAQHPVFDPRHIPQYGKQLGVKYFITGKVGAVRRADRRRASRAVLHLHAGHRRRDERDSVAAEGLRDQGRLR